MKSYRRSQASILAWVSLAWASSACSPSEVPATQLLVEVEASPAVAAKLTYVRAFMVRLDATSGSAPPDDLQFAVSTADPSPHDAVRFPFSFAIAKGSQDRFKLVIEGYESSDPQAPAVIEQKAIVSFLKGRSITVKLALLDACYQRASVCSGLDRTCISAPGTNVAAGECGPVPELRPSMASGDDATGLPAQDGGAEPADGAPDGRLGKTDASDGASPPRTIAAGKSHSCARKSDGTAVCWGSNADGQLGNGTTTGSNVPVPVSGLTGVVELAVTSATSCARKSDGKVVCWGANTQGQLGRGTLAPSSSTAAEVAGLGDAVQLVASGEAGSHFCARTKNGSVSCWGANVARPSADGSRHHATSPIAVGNLAPIVKLETPTCARKVDATVLCWDGPFQELQGAPATPVAVAKLSPLVTFDENQFYSCGIARDGSVTCWSEDIAVSGREASGGTAARSARAEMLVVGATNAVEVALGAERACARRGDGTVVCWKNEFFGGMPAAAEAVLMLRTTPAEQVSDLTGVVEIAVGSEHSCARKDDGSVVCWGSNEHGELGTGSNVDAAAPVRVQGL